MNHKAFPVHSFKGLDERAGEFEAIVSTFGNVDSQGDRVVKGAFADTLQRWEERGRPIPVVFSHEWHNLDAHIGRVLEAKEVDEGLYVKAQLEMDEPFAARVYKKLKNGTLHEFSFAYEVIDSQLVSGVHELRALEVYEVGPCLVGANRETRLLGIKELMEGTEATWVQVLHDRLVSLGAKCVEGGDSVGEGDGGVEDEAREGKSSGGPDALSLRLEIEMLDLDSYGEN